MKKNISIPRILSAAALLASMAAALQLAACDSHSQDHGSEEDYKADACEHMAEGPAESVTALASRDDSLPDVSEAHTRHDIALPDVAGSREGYVAFEADEANDFHFALNSDATLEITDADGAVVQPEGEADSGSGCSEVKVLHTYELEAGRYVLHFASGFETSVSMVAVEGGEHAH
jgi:hypothetical protein